MPDKNALELLKFYRDEIKQEFNLIAHRLTWYVTCQSFLLTAFAISKGNLPGGRWFPAYLLPTIAIALSILSFFPIKFAAQAIEKWLLKQTSLLDDRSFGLLEYQIERPGHIHWVSMWFPQLLPFVFSGAWVWILYKIHA